jgi:uncharacterized membrane protein/mono/diheme cytochrome c family protein
MELFIGRLHPLLVHFPIGLLVVALFMELMSIGGKRPGLREGVNWIVTLGAVFAILSAAMGWFLSTYDDYSGDLVQSHQRWGIATAIAATICTLLLQLTLKGKFTNLIPYRTCLFLTVAALVVTSHLGASLTHGEDFLSSALPGNTESQDHAGSMELLAELNHLDAYTETQLDRLNLEVRAIFARNCYQCHSENKKKGELVLENKRGVYQGGESGEVIIAGSSENSELFRRISLSTDHDEVMPKKGKVLKDHQIALIKLWIDQGAHWADRALEVFPEAPLALEKPDLPPSKKFTHPVDRILDDYFNMQDMDWPELVDDQTFVRRAYLDIVGLLPDPNQMNAFIENQGKNKREELVDQLLSDRHNYTQHWLSFWNDLLRNDYSGTGFITGGRKQITDWLYHSLLENKPYHLMVKQLIYPTEASEGFIKGIKWRGVVNSSQSTEMQAAQNISQSLMGMNLKCASCHNSFVSNLTLEQAYGFASIFADSSIELNRCDQPLGRFAKPAFLYTELGSVEADSLKERLLKLSQVITQPVNGRLYRTITNRLWKQLLGRGIIEPVDQMDNAPWNSQLLDWLAADFVDSGYDLKHLIRMIITSRAYQLPVVNYDEVATKLAKDYVFKGPVARRLTAEQFADAVSQVIAPVYHALAYNPVEEEFSASRIWHREIKFDRDVLPEPGDRYFRYLFDLNDNNLKSAKMLISVDHSYELYLNGKIISSGNDWRKVARLEVSDRLSSGQNIIAVKGTNEGNIANPAGILMALRIISEAGDTLLIRSDKTWRSTAVAPEQGWTDIQFNDEGWVPVKNYGSKHWDRLVTLSFDNSDTPFARASLVRQHPFMKALGRPTRENVATARADQATLLQALELTNGAYFNQVLAEGALQWIDSYDADAEKIAISLYQKSLGRAPNKRELETLADALGEKPDQQSVQDVIWATVLLPEFQFIY